jgi:hypothetical protein
MRDLEALLPILSDLAVMRPAAGPILPETGIAVGEDVRGKLSQVRTAIDERTWSCSSGPSPLPRSWETAAP